MVEAREHLPLLGQAAQRPVILDQVRAHHLADDDRVHVAVERQVRVVTPPAAEPLQRGPAGRDLIALGELPAR